MADGFFQLGEALFGGGQRRIEAARQEGLDLGVQRNLRRAQTTEALTKARQRQQETIANEEIKDAFEAMGLDPRLASIVQAGRGSDFSSFQSGRETGQGIDFREILSDPERSVAERQGAGLALRGEPVTAGDMLGPGGELAFDIFNPQADAAITTPTGEARIAADQAGAEESLAGAVLDRAKAVNPERFRSGGTTINTGGSLSETIIPSGGGQTIIPEDFDAGASFGAKGVFAKGANALFDFVNAGTPFPKTAAAQNLLSELSARTQIAMRADVPGGRPPVIVQELLARYAEDPAQLFRGDEIARNNLRTTRDALARSLQRARQLLDAPIEMTPSRQQELADTVVRLEDTVADYSAILNLIEQRQGPQEGGLTGRLGTALFGGDGGEEQAFDVNDLQPGETVTLPDGTTITRR